MSEMVTIRINGEEKQYEKGTVLEKIALEYQKDYATTIILAKYNGKLAELSKKLVRDGELSFFTISDKIGHQTYRRTACLVMIKAIYDVVGALALEKLKVEFAVDKGLYVTLSGDFERDEKFIEAVTARMNEIIEADLPIAKTNMPLDDAIEIFEAENMMDKVQLFKYRRSSRVNLYCLDGYYDYYYGYMAPSARYVNKFKLYLFGEGVVLQLTDRHNPNELTEFSTSIKVFNKMTDTTDWLTAMELSTVGDVNEMICKGYFNDIVLMQEARQEAMIASIAKDIASREGVKFVMIAGPSSSGKTTFSHRLSVQLRAHGLTPHPIALDDYFKNREDTPLDEEGNYDFECLEAIDVDGFNSDMKRLLAGETVEIPSFNFKLGKREYNGHYMTLKEDDILVIEGIHGLNEKMSYALPKESKYKIYISALTTLNVDEHNRIATNDGRLIRRMVRDNRTRGTSARKTLAMWKSVRRGEEKYIYPYQDSADVVFNSALVYELSVLKQFAEPLLFDIDKDDEGYFEARRLLKFLDCFVGVTSEHLPNNSIVREFVGGSMFPV